MKDLQQDIRDAWARVEIPNVLTMRYGKVSIWNYDGMLSRPILKTEKQEIMLFGRVSGETEKAVVAFHPKQDDLRGLLQAVLDRWAEQVSNGIAAVPYSRINQLGIYP